MKQNKLISLAAILSLISLGGCASGDAVYVVPAGPGFLPPPALFYGPPSGPGFGPPPAPGAPPPSP